mmetsp:Transcript_59236/g.144826  ORF Transcript_59236/g.144826 Transcript_59236/m.144826 type:complete len:83 (-) Transcript_59236:286-534(-)
MLQRMSYPLMCIRLDSLLLYTIGHSSSSSSRASIRISSCLLSSKVLLFSSWGVSGPDQSIHPVGRQRKIHPVLAFRRCSPDR